MDSVEKANLYNDNQKKIKNLLGEVYDKLGRKDALKIISNVLKDYGFSMVSKIVEKDFEMPSKTMFEDGFFSEGDEDSGFIPLKTVLNEFADIINCDDDYCFSGDIAFQYFVRPETKEEMEDEGHSDSVEWWTKDESVDINKLYIQFATIK